MLPLARELLGVVEGTILDLGCGEGRLLRALDGADVIGCDLSAALLERVGRSIPVVQCRLPDLRWLRPDTVEAAVCVLVLEHVDDFDAFLREVGRVLAPGGAFVLVMNHPAYTAPGAGPVVDLSDGEVLWRWGPYFEPASATEPAGSGRVLFHHRPLGTLLNTAAHHGLALQRLDERALGPEAVADQPGLAGQEHFPRLLGVRWRKVRIDPGPSLVAP